MKTIRLIVSLLLIINSLSFKAQLDSIDLNVKKKRNDTLQLPAIPKKEPKSTVQKSEKVSKDTTSKAKLHSPQKAAIYSAILPGAGQIYNKKYWKLPIIYGGGIALGYSVAFNHRNFSNFKQELIKRQQNLGGLNPELNFYSDSDLNTYQSFYRRYRDISVAGCLLLYALNVIDASVDAHLFYFSVSDDLSAHWRPELNPLTFQPQLSLFIRF